MSFVLFSLVIVTIFINSRAQNVYRNRSPGCSLPAPPTNGDYFMDNYSDAVPGETVPQATILWYSCDLNYTSPTSPLLAKCRNDSTWSSTPVCIQSRTIVNVSATQGCPLPPLPNHGSYFIPKEPGRATVPGELMNHFDVLQYACESGYDPSTTHTFCLTSNMWDATPVCLKRCELKASLTVDFSCQDHRNIWKPCPPSIPHNTLVHSKCKLGHVSIPGEFVPDISTCLNGHLNTIPKCKPDCGIEKPLSISHIHRAQDVEDDTFPWHVGIYQLFKNESVNIVETIQICGGTIVYSNVIISAAHCFWDSNQERIIPVENYRVAAGKVLRSWDTDKRNNLRIQKREVSEIRLPDEYRGEVTSQGSDLAIIVLAEPLQFTSSVKAACFDIYYDSFDETQTAAGKIGKVAGWGITETGSVSEELKSVSLPVISTVACRKELDKYRFYRYVTAGKICAGYTNGTAVCQGDSGGGLMFPHYDDKTSSVRWYLRGVVSNGPLAEDKKSCQPNTYTVFTKFYALKTWLNKEFWILMST